MKLSHKLLFFINGLAIGILAPVSSLLIVSRGATLSTLSYCMGMFAVMVVVLELPSGILADLVGRKRVYLISCCFPLAAFLLMMWGRHILIAMTACACQGIGRALGSGSIEALEIEAYISKNGEKGLSKINSQLAVTDSVGLALGSLFGGLLGYLDSSYHLLLIVCVIIQCLLLILTVLFLKEEPNKKEKSRKEKSRLPEVIQGVVQGFRQDMESPVVAGIFAMSVIIGLGVCTVEIYWQPSLGIYLPENLNWVFGVINCLGYAGVSLGNKGGEWLWNRKHSMASYWGLRLLLPFCIMKLGFCKSVMEFMLMFILFYGLLGAGNLFENTMFHGAVRNKGRAGMMSLHSLFLRGGGIGSAALGGLIMAGGILNRVWIILPGVMAAGCFLIILLFSRRFEAK